MSRCSSRTYMRGCTIMDTLFIVETFDDGTCTALFPQWWLLQCTRLDIHRNEWGQIWHAYQHLWWCPMRLWWYLRCSDDGVPWSLAGFHTDLLNNCISRSAIIIPFHKYAFFTEYWLCPGANKYFYRVLATPRCQQVLLQSTGCAKCQQVLYRVLAVSRCQQVLLQSTGCAQVPTSTPTESCCAQVPTSISTEYWLYPGVNKYSTELSLCPVACWGPSTTPGYTV